MPKKLYEKSNEKLTEEATLESRAQELAIESEVLSNQETLKIVEFILDAEYYGIESIYVSRICHVHHITPIPSAPLFIRGLINVHGQLICIIDLKQVFGLKKSEKKLSSSIIIITDYETYLGIIVDSVEKFSSINIDSLQKPSSSVINSNTEFVIGLTDSQKIILDAKKIINNENFVINDFI